MLTDHLYQNGKKKKHKGETKKNDCDRIRINSYILIIRDNCRTLPEHKATAYAQERTNTFFYCKQNDEKTNRCRQGGKYRCN